MRNPLRSLAHRALGLPRPHGPAPVSGSAPLLPRGRPLRVVSWNIQFCGGRERLFFYDGGAHVSVPADEVRANAAAIGDALAAIDADVVLLQEVDRASRRTGFVDQVPALLERAAYPTWAATPYFQVRHVPAPTREPLGRVRLDLVVLSRFRLASAWRHPLPALREPAWRRAFNLRRAVLAVDLPVEGGGVVTVFDTHLSAFSHGDGTLDRQIAEVRALCAGASGPWLVGGDFNCLPPGDTPEGLPDASEYPEATSPILPLFEHADPSLDLDAYRADRARWFTYQRSGHAPDRVLDYVFTGGMRDVSLEVLPTELSDHLPVIVTATPAG